MSDENTTPAAAPAEETKKEETKAEPKVEPKAEKAESNENIETPKEFKSIVEAIEKMSVLELHTLVKFLEKKFGVSAQAVAVAAVPGAGAEVEEKSTFNVHLTEAGAQKIGIIKIVKEVLALGLKEAKDMVDGAPVLLKEGMKKEEADALKKQIEDAGGKVELK